MSININGLNDDFYRYKMDKMIITLGGNGNGLYTTINNIESISKSINTPSIIVLKYIASNLGSNYNENKKKFSGHHKIDILQNILYQYINTFVLCNNCNIPELSYKIEIPNTMCNCSACGNSININTIVNNKIDLKVVDLINKYLEKEKKWIQIKGNMVFAIEDEFMF